MCVCVFVISNQSTSKKEHMSDLGRPDSFLHKTHVKVLLVPRLDMCRSILLLSKIAHQMWHDHPFSQRSRTTEKTVGVEVGGDREVGERGLDKVWGK